jgi:outer membrane lipoprotein LolB
MRPAKLIAGAALCGLLVGCATRPASAPPVPDLQGEAAQAAAMQQRAREQALHSAGPWTFDGRVAIQKAGKGGSGRIDWRHDGQGGDVISLSAPITRQSWQLAVFPDGSGQLDGLEGGPRSGADAEALLREATQWDIPVRALAAWAKGVASPTLGEAAIQYGADGLPRQIEQGGWRIDYPAWRQDATTCQALPARIESIRGDATVRLVIDHWQWLP